MTFLHTITNAHFTNEETEFEGANSPKAEAGFELGSVSEAHGFLATELSSTPSAPYSSSAPRGIWPGKEVWSGEGLA